MPHSLCDKPVYTVCGWVAVVSIYLHFVIIPLTAVCGIFKGDRKCYTHKGSFTPLIPALKNWHRCRSGDSNKFSSTKFSFIKYFTNLNITANSWTEDDVKHAFKTLTLSSLFLKSTDRVTCMSVFERRAPRCKWAFMCVAFHVPF